jgi:hypothetical protein
MFHEDLIQCGRCAIVFPRRHRNGRRPIYCSHTCRQRAFEARRRAVLGRDCRTCAHIAQRHPLAQPLEPSADLAELKHLLLGARTPHLRDDAEALREVLGQLLATALGPPNRSRAA